MQKSVCIDMRYSTDFIFEQIKKVLEDVILQEEDSGLGKQAAEVLNLVCLKEEEIILKNRHTSILVIATEKCKIANDIAMGETEAEKYFIEAATANYELYETEKKLNEKREQIFNGIFSILKQKNKE